MSTQNIPATGVPAARVYRGKALEAEHQAAIAVVDASGRLTHCLGDPEAVFMTRSSIKPFQALPLILTGGFDHFGFTEEHLAIMCASHSGDDLHRDVVMSCLAKSGSSPADLKCGSGRPLGMETRSEFPLHGEEKDPTRSDCSGKHAGFLALTRFLGVPVEQYLDPESKGQLMVRRSVAERCEYPVEQINVGIDGCSAPNYSLPLRNLAIGFKNLVTLQAPEQPVRDALRRARDAMRRHPILVAGEGRLDYDFMRAFPGNAVSKIGAEAIQGIGFEDPPLGIAVKVLDGNPRALAPICVAILKQLGIIERMDNHPALVRWESPEVRNARGLVTGRIAVDFRLRAA